MPLIEPDRTFALAAVIMLIVAFGLWAERRPWGRRLGGPLLLLGLAMAAANAGIIPHAAPVYDMVSTFLVPAAIPLLLMRADFKAIYTESGPMLGAFLLAACATVAGALAGAWAIDLGTLEPQIVGTITASYIGGSLNFVATAEAVGISDSSTYVAGLAADAVGAVFFLVVLMLLPASRLVRAAMPSEYDLAGSDRSHSAPADPGDGRAAPFDLAGAAAGLAVSLVVCAVGLGLASLAAMDALFVLIVTMLSLLVANFVRPVAAVVSSEFELGTLFMYAFFVCIGAGADLTQVAGAALPMLAFIVVMVLVHIVLLVTIGRLLRLDMAEVMIASNACILGPAPAAALAASRGWQPLVAPGILVGLFGYATATFVGVGLTAFLGS